MRNAITRFASAVLIVASLSFLGLGCRGESAAVQQASKPFVLKFWSVFDDEDAYAEVFAAYRQIHPNIVIEYRKFTFDEYQGALLNAIAENRGPDVMAIHNTWFGAWQPRLLPVPAVLSVPYREIQGTIRKEAVTVIRQTPGITLRQLANDYIDAVSGDVVLPTEQTDPRAPLVPRIYGLPLYSDTLALYYNRDLLNNAGVAQPAAFWKEFQEQVKRLTKLDETGAILQSGAALGTADNVERSADILSLLMLQNGAKMVDENGKAAFEKFVPELGTRQYPPGAEALIFYSDFANPAKEVYSWNDKMPNSLDAFASGKTAYFFGYSYHLATIRQRNPKLNFGIAPFPQIEGNSPVNFANYFALGVSNKTEHPDESWDFVQFLTKVDNAQKYLAATRKPTALRSLVNAQLDDLDLSTFAAELPTAKSWYHGIDAAATESAFEEMIRQMLADQADPTRIAEIGATKVNQTIK
jgi:ABC-type glycerol-3-phosphate transport system substrate-binding protein